MIDAARGWLAGVLFDHVPPLRDWLLNRAWQWTYFAPPRDAFDDD